MVEIIENNISLTNTEYLEVDLLDTRTLSETILDIIVGCIGILLKL